MKTKNKVDIDKRAKRLYNSWVSSFGDSPERWVKTRKPEWVRKALTEWFSQDDDLHKSHEEHLKELVNCLSKHGTKLGKILE